ncbi:MAG: hypothetical protein KDA56_17460, partial [Hyphomonas sp.]|nr:hypothetical protein [Hyphomonas sp.]
GNWQGVARFGLGLLTELDSGEVRLSDDTLRVSGTELDAGERARLSAQVSALAAPYRGVPLIKGLPVWTATHSADGLVLSGKVASDAQRRDLVGIAQAHAYGEVIDRMEIAPDMPDNWTALAEAGLPEFARFREGEMGFYPADGDAGFAVEGEAPASAIQFLKEDLSGPLASGPDSVPVTIWADPTDVDVPEVAAIDFAADPAASCESAFEAVLAANPILFNESGTGLSRTSGAALDKLLALSHLCPSELLIEIRGQADPAADPASGAARAEAVMSYLAAAGVDRQRLSAVGYGPDPSGQSNDNDGGQVKNRRIGIKVLTRSD